MVFYGLTFGVIGLAWSAMWRYGVRGRRLVDAAIEQRSIASMDRRFRLGGAISFVIALVALVNSSVAMPLFGLPAVFFILPLFRTGFPSVNPGAWPARALRNVRSKQRRDR